MIIKALWITLVTILVVSVAAEAKSVGDRSPLIPDALLVHYGGLNVGEKFSYGLVSLKDPSYQRSLWSKPPIQRASNFVITASGIMFYRDNELGGVFAAPLPTQNTTLSPTPPPAPKLIAPLPNDTSTGLAITSDVKWLLVGVNDTVRRYSIDAAGPNNYNFDVVARFSNVDPNPDSPYYGKMRFKFDSMQQYLYFGRFYSPSPSNWMIHGQRNVVSRCLLNSMTGTCINGTDTILYNGQKLQDYKCSLRSTMTWFDFDESRNAIVFSSCGTQGFRHPGVFEGSLDGSQPMRVVTDNLTPTLNAFLAVDVLVTGSLTSIYVLDQYTDSMRTYIYQVQSFGGTPRMMKSINDLLMTQVAFFPPKSTSTNSSYYLGSQRVGMRGTRTTFQSGVFVPKPTSNSGYDDLIPVMTNDMILPPDFFATNTSGVAPGRSSSSATCTMFQKSTEMMHAYPQYATIVPDKSIQTYLPHFQPPLQLQIYGGNITYDPRTQRLFWFSAVGLASASKLDGSDAQKYGNLASRDVNVDHPIYVDPETQLMYYLHSWNGTINVKPVNAPVSDPGSICVPQWCCDTYGINRKPGAIQRFWIDFDTKIIRYAVQGSFRGDSVGPAVKTVMLRAYTNCTLAGYEYSGASPYYYDRGGFQLGKPLHPLAFSPNNMSVVYSWLDRGFDYELAQATLSPPTVINYNKIPFTPTILLVNGTTEMQPTGYLPRATVQNMF